MTTPAHVVDDRQRRRGVRVKVRPDQLALDFDRQPDRREQLLDRIRPGVFAMWSDPRERPRLRRSA